jgi:hypothetical protein
VSYELLAEGNKDVEWVTYDHSLHGYIFPVKQEDGTIVADKIQKSAIAMIISYLDRYLK